MRSKTQVSQQKSSSANKLLDDLEVNIREVSLPSALESFREPVADAVSKISELDLPELNDKQKGASYGARSTQKGIMKGSHRVIGQSTRVTRVPIVSSIADRFRLAGRATLATPGGRLMSGLSRGILRLGGRLIAPAIFALDVYSESDRARGVSKATGGLLAASAGFMISSSIGAGIGTLVFPGVGTAAGYYVGGLVGAALAYGGGKQLAASAYDWAVKNHPDKVAAVKNSFSTGIEKGKQVFSRVSAAAKEHVPKAFAAAKNWVSSFFD